MIVAVSNIAWPAEADHQAYALLGKLGLNAIEIAPTRIWPNWNDATLETARDLRQQLAQTGFTVPSLQAILFGRPDCKLFGTAEERRALLGHLEFCASLAVATGARRVVFGAPKNRDRNTLTAEAAFDAASDLFRQAALFYAQQNICLCLEANPPQYACNFVTNSHEAAALVRAVDSPGFRLHLDTACMALAGEDLLDSITSHFDLLQHFHASEPELGRFENPTIDHAAVAQRLKALGYTGVVSLEMRPAPEPIAALRVAASTVQAAYS